MAQALVAAVLFMFSVNDEVMEAKDDSGVGVASQRPMLA
jgi:hypothetical protein